MSSEGDSFRKCIGVAHPELASENMIMDRFQMIELS